MQNLEQIDIVKSYLFDVYGISEKEIKDIKDFKTKIKNCLVKFDGLKNKSTVKEIVDIGNIVPTYSTLAIMRVISLEDKDLLPRVLPDCIDFYNKMKKEDAEGTATKDFGETIINVIFFSPETVLRRIVKERYDIVLTFIKEVNNRFMVFPPIMNSLAELFIGTKDQRFIDDIVALFKIVIAKINECDNILAEVKSVMPMTLKEGRALMKQYLDAQSKKNSLSQLKILLTRKFEFAQIFHGFVTLCPFAGDVLSHESFPDSIIRDSIVQMKLYQVIEVYNYLKDSLIESKLNIIKEFLEKVQGVNVDALSSKLTDLISKIPEEKFGVLGRQVSLMPSENESTILGCLKEMISKLSTVANNLTVIISEKSLSLTIAVMSRNSIYSEFNSQFQKIESGSQLAKMMDKDVMKKIKETNVAALTLDQMSIAKVVSVLHSMVSVLSQDESLSKDDVMNKGFELTIKELKMMMNKRFYSRIFNIFYAKCKIEGIKKAS